MSRRVPEMKGWASGDVTGPAAFLRGHLKGRYVGDRDSLRRATHESICVMLERSGMTRADAELRYADHFEGRTAGVGVTRKGVVFDFDAGEVDQPAVTVEVVDR